MSVKRKVVYEALLTLLKGVNTNLDDDLKIQNFTRRYVDPSKAGSGNQPLMLLLARNENNVQQEFALPTKRWRALIVVYFMRDAGGDLDVYPTDIVFAYLDAIDAMIQAEPAGEKQTLGGLVTHVWVDGDIGWNEGLDDVQGMVVVPVTILLGL